MTCEAFSETLGAIRAKSAADGKAGMTLEGHTSAVVSRLGERRARCPTLADIVGEPRLWRWAFWAVVLHDFGKVCRGFQAQLAPGAAPWGHRHEVASVAFVPWVAGDDPEELGWLTAGVASHHRDISDVLERYLPFDAADDPVPELLGEINDDLAEALGELLLVRAASWADRCGIQRAGATPRSVPPPGRRAAWLRSEGPAAVVRALRAWKALRKQLEDEPSDSRSNRTAIALRGLVVLSDHTASATAHVCASPLANPAALASSGLAIPRWLPHQNAAAEVVGSAILSAPTGSGKTEAALRWAAAQGGQTPLVYLLPYQASLNAMKLRLDRAFGAETCTLEHARAASVLYLQALDKGYGPQDAERDAKRQRNLARLHAAAVRIATPYQILKAAFQLPGFEASWTDLAGARFVLDEIHAYDSERVALILTTLAYAVRAFDARAFIMSATLPSVLRRRINDAIGPAAELRATPETLADFRRHTLRRMEGGFDTPEILEVIAARVTAGESVLVVANTVRRARAVARKLRHLEPVLLHSRFVGRDRAQKERWLQSRMKTGVRAPDDRGCLCIATQVVEVSLDVDFDVLFTEPAPLEALLQRFGRVNRGRRGGLRDVFVLTEPIVETAPYGPEWIRGTVAVLDRTHAWDQAIDESRVEAWLDEVYAGPAGETWTLRLDQCIAQYERDVTRVLRAFESCDEVTSTFDDLFDGYEVVPASFEEEARHLARENPLRLPEVLLPITARMRQRWKRERRVRELLKRPRIESLSVEYDTEWGLGGESDEV